MDMTSHGLGPIRPYPMYGVTAVALSPETSTRPS